MCGTGDAHAQPDLDVLYYHFPLAQIYAKHHQLAPTLVIKQSYYPQSAEVLMTLAMSLGDKSRRN